jgi:hypothetical protein
VCQAGRASEKAARGAVRLEAIGVFRAGIWNLLGPKLVLEASGWRVKLEPSLSLSISVPERMSRFFQGCQWRKLR